MPKYRREARRIVSALAFFVALGAVPSATEGFATKLKQRQRQRVLTRRHFRHEGPRDVSLVSNALLPQAGKMPIWLRQSRGHKKEEKMEELRDAMLESFFTDNEVLKLVFAINEAAGGDRNKMAGAADFCLILVEMMEMGLNALIAAAFHYCSCVTAREQSLLLPPGAASTAWEGAEIHNGLSSFGEHAVAIARDAAQLKRLEMLATSLQNPETSRVSPDTRDSENLLQLLLTETEDWRALAIRSGACLFRLRGLLDASAKDLSPEAVRVGREALYIYAPLASRLGFHRLKNELEDAAFSLLYRRQYETVTSLQRQIRRCKKVDPSLSRRSLLELDADEVASTLVESMQQALEDATRQVREMLRNDKEFSSVADNVVVTARVKEPYSMWRKMLRNRANHILQVPDALALRIVFDSKKLSPDEDSEVTRARERALCYYVQKLCTDRWKPLKDNPRFKDYIERPKQNGYMSLHYTASVNWGCEDWKMEIQIRSGEMHKVAEYGLASHWGYKAQSRSGMNRSQASDDAYLRSVQEWRWQQHAGSSIEKDWDASPASSEPLILSDASESRIRADRIRARTARLAPYIEALTEAQSDLAREHVFVFLHSQDSVHTEGKVLALSSGSCVLDALREGERALGLQLNWREELSLVTLNGSTANVTTKLKNGDILTVSLQKGQVSLEQR